ncbi:DEK1 [Symbiodinium natans]|uniref:DEK1 protein n=1 Tax=Symbiodinium natans TaxID=878477 RepID=A0A812RWR9_9DINO|nr:DEK1 [Symbiodinium natans]
MPNSKRLAAWVDTVLALWCCRDLFRVRPILRKGLRRPAWASAEVRNLNTRRRIWAGKIQDAKRLVARTYADKVGEVRLAQGVAKIGQFCEEASATWTLFLQAQDDAKAVLYVDREGPGWDCTVSKPNHWIRAKELREGCELFKDNGDFNDIDQGSTGDCYLLGALASVAANRKAFFRQVFIAYDMDVGVYGLLFCKDSHFTYEIVDDVLAAKNHSRAMYAESTDRTEMWVSILEKAFFKHYTCIEMCDGGHGTEAAFSFLGGLAGRYAIGDDEFDHPEKFFDSMKRALTSGEIMTTGFSEPSKGKYADMGGGADGQCGEKGLPFGLHGGHCYSVIRVAEVDGSQLFCFRNPWAHGEWTGPWGDKSEEWTDERREAVGSKAGDDGVFYMAVQDYVQLSNRSDFLRTFGPAWQTVRSYGRFSDAPMKARAKKNYQAQDDDAETGLISRVSIEEEISFDKGDTIDVIEVQGLG